MHDPVNGTGTPRYFPVSLTFVFKLLVTLHDVFLKNFHASPHGSAYASDRRSGPKLLAVSLPQALRLLKLPLSFPEPLRPRSVWDCKGRNLFLTCKIIFFIFSEMLKLKSIPHYPPANTLRSNAFIAKADAKVIRLPIPGKGFLLISLMFLLKH